MSILTEGVIFDIQRYCIHDGPGIRTTVFFKGCPLDCWWCHNPESKRPDREMIFWADRCIGCRRCVEVCPAAEDVITGKVDAPSDLSGCDLCEKCTGACPTGALELVGRTVTAGEILEEVRKDVIFYDESGGGVTLSGGEPFMQPAFLLEVLQRCRDEGIRTAVDTSGHVRWSDIENAAALVDLFLYDLKVIDREKHEDLAGVGNDLILANLEKLTKVHANIRVRFPLIPGHTDDEENLEEMAGWMKSAGLDTIDVLPYHNTGIDKYRRLGMDYRLESLSKPSDDRVEAVAEKLQNMGLIVKIGG